MVSYKDFELLVKTGSLVDIPPYFGVFSLPRCGQNVFGMRLLRHRLRPLRDIILALDEGIDVLDVGSVEIVDVCRHGCVWFMCSK